MKFSFLFLTIFFSTQAFGQISEFIHVDQFGYISTADKIAVISNPINGYNSASSYTPGANLELRNFLTEAVAFSASPSIWNSGATHAQSGDAGWWFDFSSVTTVGTYYVYDPSTGDKSAVFEINENPYLEVIKSAVKMFYYNRCNHSKEAPFAESSWTDETNFLNSLQDSNCRDIDDPSNASTEKELSGGWFDAGDFNKYVTFAHPAVQSLFSAYEENENIFGDDWNLPESGNGLSDLLDEIKWELDWLMKMTNSDGTVHIKMGSKNYSENVSTPPSANIDQRYYGPTCTSASIAIASMFSHAAKIYSDESGMATFAQDLEDLAIDCWDHFKSNFDAGTLETNCDDGSIVAGDADWNESTQKEVAIVAATYLFELTDDTEYSDFINLYYEDVEPMSIDYWGPGKVEIIDALLLYSSLPNIDTIVRNDILNSASTDITNNWNDFFAFSDDDLYRAQSPDWLYHWGSNLPKSNLANLCQIMKKHNVLPSAANELEEKSAEQIHYFHGVNPLGIVYLSNMYSRGGDRCADEIYHGWFSDGSDWDDVQSSLYGPAPGFVPGGANKDFTVSSISPPASQPPQKSYLDFNNDFPDNSWEISEPAIYYQAAYIRMLANYVNNTVVTSIKDILSSNNCVEVFPNPSSDYFRIKGLLDNYKIVIIDNNGAVHQTIVNTGSEAVINIANLPAGLFLVKLENLNNSDICIQKIVKE